MKALLPLFLSAVPFLSACSLTPAEIQSDTAFAVNGGLNLAVIVDAPEKSRIDQDALVILQTLDALIPNFFPGATGAQFASTAVTQTLSLLGQKLATSPTGTKVTDIVNGAENLFLSYLTSVASPTALMSAAHQANALAFFTGAAQGIAKHLNRPDLMPPTPPASTPPTSTPPTTTPTPPASTKSP